MCGQNHAQHIDAFILSALFGLKLFTSILPIIEITCKSQKQGAVQMQQPEMENSARWFARA